MIKTTAAYKEALKEKGIFHHKAIIDFPDGSNDTVEDLDTVSYTHLWSLRSREI